MAIPIGFLLLYFASLKTRDINRIIIINILVFSLILIHYPLAFVFLIGTFFVLLHNGEIKEVRYISVGCILGILWGVIKLKYQIGHVADSVVASSGGIALTVENLLTFTKGLYPQIFYYFDSTLSKVLFVSGILGLLTMTLIVLKKKRYLYFMAFFYVNLFFLYIISFFKELSFIGIVASTQIITFFIFIYIGAGFLFGKILLPFLSRVDKRFVSLLYVFAIILCTYCSYQTYRDYRIKQEALNMVSADDIEAFEWIEKNIGEDEVILNNAQIGNRKNIVYPSDAGAWIPVYTDYSVVMPFSEFSAKKTHEYYQLLLDLREDGQTCAEIDNIASKNFEFYYKGSRGVFGEQLELEENENFELVFSNESVKIFKIIPCNL